MTFFIFQNSLISYHHTIITSIILWNNIKFGISIITHHSHHFLQSFVRSHTTYKKYFIFVCVSQCSFGSTSGKINDNALAIPKWSQCTSKKSITMQWLGWKRDTSGNVVGVKAKFK